MNERIKELRKKAWAFVTHDLETVERDHVVTYAEHIEMHYAKFAELIVRECAGICEKDGRWWAEKGYLMEAGEAGSLATQIKEHFGVEE